MTADIDLLHIMWQGEVGGAERAVYQLALHQHLRGDREVAIAFGQARGRWAEKAREAGIRVIDLKMRNGRDMRAMRRTARVFARSRIHHLHGIELPILVASSGVAGASRVYTHRGGLSPYEGRQAWRYRLAAPFIRHRFTVTGNTRHGAAAARKLFSIPRDVEIPATYNGLDFELLEARVDRVSVREREHVSPGTVVIGTAANLRPWKRIDWLIEAAGRMPPGDWAVWIMGDGPDRARLEALAQASPARDRIRFLGKQDQVADWLCAMDAFALPSGPLESFGNAAVEAMACGLPTIVARSSPGLVEHVSDGESGFVIDDVDDLRIRLEQLVADEALRDRLGTRARHYVRTTYTMERAVERYDAVYRRATGA